MGIDDEEAHIDIFDGKHLTKETGKRAAGAPAEVGEVDAEALAEYAEEYGGALPSERGGGGGTNTASSADGVAEPTAGGYAGPDPETWTIGDDETLAFCPETSSSASRVPSSRWVRRHRRRRNRGRRHSRSVSRRKSPVGWRPRASPPAYSVPYPRIWELYSHPAPGVFGKGEVAPDEVDKYGPQAPHSSA